MSVTKFVVTASLSILYSPIRDQSIILKARSGTSQPTPARLWVLIKLCYTRRVEFRSHYPDMADPTAYESLVGRLQKTLGLVFQQFRHDHLPYMVQLQVSLFKYRSTSYINQTSPAEACIDVNGFRPLTGLRAVSWRHDIQAAIL